MLPVLLVLLLGLVLRVSSTAQDPQVPGPSEVRLAVRWYTDQKGTAFLYASQYAETRQARSDVRSMMDKMDPNFWPTRGRRSSSSSSEETPPPFWAHRGRAIDELESALTERAGSEEVAPPFWAHRGREITCPEHGSMSFPLSAEEPRWVMFNRRDAEEVGPSAEDTFWISQSPRGLSSNEFWVSRGKKERNQKKDVLRGLAMQQDDFYPTRGKRSDPKPTFAS